MNQERSQPNEELQCRERTASRDSIRVDVAEWVLYCSKMCLCTVVE